MSRAWKITGRVLLAGLALIAGGRAAAQSAAGEDGRAEIEWLQDAESAEEGDLVGYITTRIAVYGVGPDGVALTPERYHGRVLSVAGAVGEIVSPHVFTLHEPGDGPRPSVIIVSRLPLAELAPGQTVRVIGQLRPLVFAELEADFDWFDRSWFGSAGPDLDRHPTLVAASVTDVAVTRELMQEVGLSVH
jgi:hypothetical protein